MATPKQIRKEQRYKDFLGVGAYTAKRAAEGDAFALNIIKEQRKKWKNFK